MCEWSGYSRATLVENVLDWSTAFSIAAPLVVEHLRDISKGGRDGGREREGGKWWWLFFDKNEGERTTWEAKIKDE
jgi:hypothetical protein